MATYFLEHITRHLKVTHYYFNNLDKAFDVYSHYDKKLLVGDFNTEVSGNVLGTFLYQMTLKILSKIKLVSKMQRLLAPLSFFLTNNPLAFQNTATTFTGLSDCHKLVLTVSKTNFH